MERIIDYVRWYSDFTFDILPFNEVDNLVLCALSYWKFPKMDWLSGKYPLNACYAALNGAKAEMMTTDTDETMADFVRYACASKRFGELFVSDYVDEFFPEVPIQFSAVTFHLDSTTRYIAFRGTDSSIAGWKEDFMISFMETKAQKLSLEYLQDHIQPHLAYYVGGHSKGANEVLYAAALLPDHQKAQLKHLYINDGPGFCKEVLDPRLLDSIDAISTAIRPEYCVIGKIFEPKITDCRIVKSTQKAGMQHSIFSWGVDCGRLALAQGYDPQSLALEALLDKWLENVSPEERKTFTNSIFDALEKDGSKTLFDVLNKWPASFENVIVSMLDADAVTKETLLKLPEAAIHAEKKAASKVTVLVKKEIAHQPYLLDAAIALTGILLLLLPVYFFDLVMAAVLFLAFAAETAYTVRRLIRNRWNAREERTRITLCLILLVIFLLILVKEQALFVLSSALFGGALLYYAYYTAAKLKQDRRWGTFFWLHLAEAVIFALCGLFILVAPQWAIRWYAVTVGIILIVDAVTHAVIRLLKIKNEK
ncbi:MAG: DUF2974 domain-containing protein [Clostridia bacterium]|nr:DUF2974 domain-containing protein [Clostridia bacterium]